MNYYLRLDGSCDEIVREPVLKDGYGKLIWKHELTEYKTFINKLVDNQYVLFAHPMDSGRNFTNTEIVTCDAGFLPFKEFISYANQYGNAFHLLLNSFEIKKGGVEICFTQIINNGYLNQLLRCTFIDNFLNEA